MVDKGIPEGRCGTVSQSLEHRRGAGGQALGNCGPGRVKTRRKLPTGSNFGLTLGEPISLGGGGTDTWDKCRFRQLL